MATFSPLSAYGFQVLPPISDVDRKLTTWGDNVWRNGIGQWFLGNAVPMLKSPVHEAIALNALSCSVEAGAERKCVSRAFLTLWQEGAPWDEAEKYFDCVFALDEPNTPAGPGHFRRRNREQCRDLRARVLLHRAGCRPAGPLACMVGHRQPRLQPDLRDQGPCIGD